jgi:hypothetical protein
MIERMYPGVYLAEVEFSAKSIDGVPTTQPGVVDDFRVDSRAVERAALPAHTPEWTNLQAGDPGVTLVELFGFLTESLLYRTDLSATADKYIGETEKRLGTVFSDAAPASPLLRYDDTHALFRKPD